MKIRIKHETSQSVWSGACDSGEALTPWFIACNLSIHPETFCFVDHFVTLYLSLYLSSFSFLKCFSCCVPFTVFLKTLTLWQSFLQCCSSSLQQLSLFREFINYHVRFIEVSTSFGETSWGPPANVHILIRQNVFHLYISILIIKTL